MISDAKSIITAFEKAKAEKTVTESTWEDLLYYGFPRKRGVNTKYEPGEKPSWDVFDDTAVQSNLILAAGLSGYMTNASQQWFELRARNEEVMSSKGVRKFFSDSAEVLYSIFANSNFYQQAHECYIDLGVVGNACMYIDEDAKDHIRFYTRHPKEAYIVEDDREEVRMVFRRFSMGAYQAYKFFGEANCGEAVRKAVIESKDYHKQFDFIHYVCERHERVSGKMDAKNKPFASYWVGMKDVKILREGGYDEFPYVCPRFYKNSGETYGYGPMYTTFPEVGTVNKSVETYYKAAEISMYPPWLLENDGIMGTLDLRSGALNYQRNPLSQGQQAVPLIGKGNIQVGIDFIQRSEEKIKRAFFVDLFLMLTNQSNMTATEVMERTQEKMLIMGPVLGRLQNEFLNPIIYRGFNIALRRGLLPQVPQELQGQDWDVVYVSPLAKAQRAVMARDLNTFIGIIGQMAQFKPDVLDKINSDAAIDKMARAYSIDPDVVNDDEMVDAIREQRAQAMQQQQQTMALANAAQIADTAGSATEKFSRARATDKQK